MTCLCHEWLPGHVLVVMTNPASVCLFVLACIHASVHVRAFVRVHACRYACVRVCVHVRACVCERASEQASARMFVYLCETGIVPFSLAHRSPNPQLQTGQPRLQADGATVSHSPHNATLSGEEVINCSEPLGSRA